MRPEHWEHLRHIQRAVSLLKEFTGGKTFTDYEGDIMLRSAVERQFGIVGEATARLAKADSQVASKISQCRRIIDFRNVLVHRYDAVDDLVVWGVVEKDLPILDQEVADLLRGAVDE